MIYGERFFGRCWGRERVPCRFRVDPVPYSGRRMQGYFSAWYKTPKTTQEKRRFYGDKGLVRIRGKRTPCYLPNAWDDYPRADRYIKYSWKKNKKQRQWM